MAFRSSPALTLLLVTAAGCGCPAVDGPDDLTVVLEARQPLPDGTYVVEIASPSTTLRGAVQVTAGTLACVDECLFDALGPAVMPSLAGHMELDVADGAHRLRAEITARHDTPAEIHVVVRRDDVVIVDARRAPGYREQERCPGTTAATVTVGLDA